MRHARLSMLLGRGASAVVLVAAPGCSSPRPATDEHPGGATPVLCDLEDAVERWVTAEDTRVCASRATNGGVLGPRDEIRRCVFESIETQQPFTAIWSGNYMDHVGYRWGWVGQPQDEEYRLWMIEYTLAHGKERWSAYQCRSAVDLEQACAVMGQPFHRCEKDLRHERHDLECEDGQVVATCTSGAGVVVSPE